MQGKGKILQNGNIVAEVTYHLKTKQEPGLSAAALDGNKSRLPGPIRVSGRLTIISGHLDPVMSNTLVLISADGHMVSGGTWTYRPPGLFTIKGAILERPA